MFKLIASCCLSVALSVSVCAQTSLEYVPAPPDNPLKGLVPYARPHADRFPHSMEFSYLPLSDLMTGPETFNWQPLEDLLNDIASRRKQTVFRIWMEYPGHQEGIPLFLEQDGLQVTEWLYEATEPFPPAKVRTPDYKNQQLRAALKSFIKALGQRYDGDPRIGYITAGLLGVWGEWHNYPRSDLMASKEVQTEVMDAYEAAFAKTPVLLRYPAGKDTYAYAANDKRRLGYHDDSFAWATLDTGRPEDSWFFMPALKAAGPSALTKWKVAPIGGEIRPEVWGQIFDDKPQHKQAQAFADCVQQTHATWLMDTGMFREPPSPERVRNATQQVQRMGYEFHLTEWQLQSDVTLVCKIRNTGVAPFYHDWQVELAVLASNESRDSKIHGDGHVVGQSVKTLIPVDWSVAGLLPQDAPRRWAVKLPVGIDAKSIFAVRIANPMQGGLPLRFANSQDLQ